MTAGFMVEVRRQLASSLRNKTDGHRPPLQFSFRLTRFECGDEVAGLRRKCPAVQAHDSVNTLRKIFVDGYDLQPFTPRQTDAHDNRDSHTEFDIALDDFPSPHLEPHFVWQMVLLKHKLYLPPGAEVARRQNQWVS